MICKILLRGTGANLILPLLGYAEFGWQFIATENDPEAIENARWIVKENELEDCIELIENSGQKILENVVQDKEFDVAVCNPPFFANQSQRRSSYEEFESGYEGRDNELITKGGEFGFVRRYMIESYKFRTSTRLFTSMIGMKKNLERLSRFLCGQFPGVSLKTASLYQGKTTRWAIGWSFN